MTTEDPDINEGEDDADNDLETRLDLALGIPTTEMDDDVTREQCQECQGDAETCGHKAKVTR